MMPGTHRVAIGDAELVVHVVGNGREASPPAIVISGGPGLAWDYLRLPPAIADRIALAHLELVGTGDSARLPDPSAYGRARDVADVEGLRAHLDAPQVVLVGHSYGGFVALDYALAHPDRVAGLVLYDTAPTSGVELWTEIRANVQARAGAPWFPEVAAAMADYPQATTDHALAAAFARLAPLYLHDHAADPRRWDAWFARIRISAARARGGAHDGFDVRTRLPELRMPTLVLVGASDFVCPLVIARAMADAIPDAELVELRNSGHFGHVEEPEAFAAAVVAFVDRLEGSRAP